MEKHVGSILPKGHEFIQICSNSFCHLVYIEIGFHNFASISSDCKRKCWVGEQSLDRVLDT